MSNLLRKVDMVKVLSEAGIQFDPEATVNQLRPLYDDVIYHLQRNANQLRDTEANGSDFSAAIANKQQQQQNDSFVIEVGDDGEVQHRNQSNVTEAIGSLTNTEATTAATAAATAAEATVAMIQMRQQQPLQQPIVNIVDEDELNRKLTIARKQLELMQLRDQINSFELRRFNYNAFDGMVHKFTGDDAYEIKKWFEDMEKAFALFDSKDSDKLMAAHRAIDGTAKTFLRSKQVLSYNELKELMLKEFDRKWTAREVYNQMKERKWQPNESVRRYVAVMEEIASRADIAEIDLIDCIIEGLILQSLECQYVIQCSYVGRF